VRAGVDVVLLGAMDASVHAVRLSDGARLWDTRLGRISIPSIHAFDADTAVAGAGVKSRGRGVVALVNVADGSVSWTWNAPGTVKGPIDVTGSRAAADERRIVFGGWDNHVRALDATTGEEQWAQDTGAPIVCTPLIVNGRVYIGTDGGQLFSLDSHTGERLDIFPSSAPLDGEIKHAPLLAGQQLIVPAHDGAAYALTI
jgi:outer membrane protein assembly factor BamB